MKFLVIEGTVREGRKSIHAARHAVDALEAKGHEAELFDMAEHDVPMLRNRRNRTDDPHPDVELFGRKVEDADALMLVTPEYNHSIPGALKNLLDHLYDEYEDKPFSFITVTRGGFGGVRALEHLRLLTVNFKAHPGPALPLSRVNDVFSDDGELVDKEYGERFSDFLDEAIEHAEKFA